MRPRRRKHILSTPSEFIVMQGKKMTLKQIEIDHAADLAKAEPEVLDAMEELIDAKMDGKSTNETAKVTAATKVLDMLADETTPGNLRKKLEKLRHPAVIALRNVVNHGTVAAARANAGSYLFKALKATAPSAWPPDDSAAEFKRRMELATEMCSFPPPPVQDAALS